MNDLKLFRHAWPRWPILIYTLVCTITAGMAYPAWAQAETGTRPLALPQAPVGRPPQAASDRDQEWATPLDGAPNLHRVTSLFYRSAQLNRNDVARLQALGIKTVVSLRAFHADARLLKESGIKTVRIPIYTWDIDDRQVIDALRAIRAAEHEGAVLLHCQHGADRTGLISAMYRMLYQGWSKDRALDELLHGGYGFHSMWKNIVRYVQRVDLEKIRRGVERQPPAD
jgi:protein tyrosine/serine phosphatase